MRSLLRGRKGAVVRSVPQDGRVRARVLPAALMSAALLASACSNGAGSATGSVTSSASSAPSPAPTGGATARPTAGSGVVVPTPAAPAWKDCRDGFQCSTIAVPLDYASPAGGSVTLSLIRRRASGPGPRIGSLLVNPGGPGVSAVDFLRGFAKGSAPTPLLQRFDLVAFDPRGTTGSAPVHCASTAELDAFFHVDPAPDSPAEIRQLVDANRAFGAGCERRSGRILPHLSTVDAARDMDSVRAALRESKLTYLGYSYGTALGASYLDQFPTHVRAMVLDGALDPRLSWDQLIGGQARGFEQAFGAFLRWCDSNAARCEFRRAVAGDLGKAYDAIAARVERAPLPGAGGRTVGPGELTLGAGQALYSTSYWEFLGSALAQATKGGGSQLLQLSDLYLDRSDRGYANTIEANFAVNCIDRPWPKDPSAYQRLAERSRAYAPRFGPAITWSGDGCADWPVPATGTPHAVTGKGSPPIVVIGTTRDPATPYAWAVGLARQLDRGVLVTHEGDGHTAYRASAAACILDPVTSYLLTGRPPAPYRC